MASDVKLLAGTCSRYLAGEVAKHYGSPLAKMDVHRFSDGEMQPEIHESVRGVSCLLYKTPRLRQTI
jgi:ribose-phosphate pyrophosphokinase